MTHPHITSQSHNPNFSPPIQFFFYFPQNAPIFKENLPEGQILTSHNTYRKQSADLKKISFLPLGCIHY